MTLTELSDTYVYLMVQIFLLFKKFQTSLIFISFCLLFITMFCDKGKHQSTWFENLQTKETTTVATDL